MQGDTLESSPPAQRLKALIMKKTFPLLTTLAAMLLSVGAAQASFVPTGNTISYDASYGPAGTDWAAPGQALALQKFNPLLGTLNSVHFDWSGQLNSSFWVYNPSLQSAIVSYTANGGMSFNFPSMAAQQLVFGPQTGLLAVGADQDATLAVDLTGGSGTTLLADWASFVGADTFDVLVTAQGTSAFNGAGNVDTEVVTSASARVKVSYDYTPNRNAVPEPTGLALVGLALAAAGLMSRRRA